MKRPKKQNLDWFTQLNRFLMRVDELKETRFYKAKFVPKLTISRKENEEAKYNLPEPDLDDLRSFLTIYRQFISKGEPIFINTIFNIGSLHITDEEIRRDLVNRRKELKDFQKCTGLRIISKSKGKEIPPMETCKLWIIKYFHTDDDKLSELESFNKTEWHNYRFQFLGFVTETTKLIVYVADIISKAIENNALSENIN